jgi:uncharacterized protein
MMYEFINNSFLLLIIGVGAGILGSLIGIGGGIIISPALAFLGLAPAQVASTSLIAVSSTSSSSVIAYARLRKIKYSIGLKMALFSSPGAILGAFLSINISPVQFRLLFAVLLLATGLYLLFRNSVLSGQKFNTNSILFKIMFYFGSITAGIISSLFGIGGGVLFVPLLVLIIGMNMSSAVPTSQLALLSTSLVGTITHVILGNPEYVYALFLCIGSFAGAQIGAKLSGRFRGSTLEKIFAFVLMAVAVRFLLDLYLNK